jgi:hypothetical protein
VSPPKLIEARAVRTAPFFPEGTSDFHCYVHPQAGVGVAIAAKSVVLGILVVFTSILVRTSLAARR